jgi:plasmid stabilization system protein ParE
MKIVILPSACDDLVDGFHFYEDQGEGLGVYFLESLFSDVDSLILYAGIHRKIFGSHRLLSKRFPYAIYYTIESQTIRVKAVLDCRRNPAVHRRKLRASRNR